MSDVSPQLEALERGALVRPMSTLRTLIIAGPERQSWLAGQLTADIRGLKPGQGRYALSVSRTGKVQAEVWVVIDAEQIFVSVREDIVDSLYQALDTYLIMEDAELLVSDDPYAWWLGHGPRAPELVEAAREAGAIAGLAALGEIETAVIVAPERTTHNLAEVLTSVDGAMLATPMGWERIRIERMLPRFGVDFDVDCYPQEACLENLAVSFDKGCYVGQEAGFMLEKRGHVKKRLVRLAVAGGVDLSSGDEVYTPQGEKVGHITSSVRAEGSTWAMAMVRYKHTVTGTELVVDDSRATVSCLSAREQCT